MKQVTATILAVLFVFVIVTSAQAPPQMPQPAPELKKLDYMVGTWSWEGDLKPSPFGPGGKITGTDHMEWMQGGFFLVLHSKMKGAWGDGSSLAVMGYDPDEKVYTYQEFNSRGEHELSKGTVDGDTWSWNSDENVGGKKMKGRYSMKILSPTTYSFKFELSPDGTDWNTVMDGKSTKLK